MQLKTDLVLEAATLINSHTKKDYTLTKNKTKDGFVKTMVDVLNEEGSKLLNKKMGKYITIDAEDNYLFDETVKKYFAKELSNTFTELMNSVNVNKPKKVFVVGLGNKQMVSDSLGPKVTEKIVITRHLKEVVKTDESTNELNSISAIATGVLGTTGIETARVVKSLVNEVKPDVVILIDTLSTLETKRIANSFQLSNAGLIPGAGVGNSRQAIDSKTLGVPVIVVGVPLVVHAYTMCSEVLSKVSEEMNLQEKDPIINNIANSVLGDLVVTIKDIDKVVENCADIIALSINLAVNPSLDFDQIKENIN
jgi:spore protease